MGTVCHGLILLVNPFTSNIIYATMHSLLTIAAAHWMNCVLYEKFVTMTAVLRMFF